MGNSVEYISQPIIVQATFQLLSGTRGERGHCFPCSFIREATGAELTFHHSNIGNFMVNMIQLKQIYCSYSRTHNIQNGVLHSLLLFLRSTLLLNRNKHIGEECFVCYTASLNFNLNTFTGPCPTAASAATCVLCNSTCKVIISADMIIEIQITKLLAKLLTESHWRQIFSRLKYVAHLNHISFLIK